MNMINALAVTGISPDGLTLVGYGTNREGRIEGWIAHLDHPLFVPEPSTWLLAGLGFCALLARRRWSTRRAS
jgi:hypothetical protein